MKKLVLLAGILGMVACNRTERITIKGKFSEVKGEKIYFDQMNLLNVKKIDSLKIGKNGRFHFRIKSKQPEFFQLKLSNNQYLNFLLYPGDKVNVRGNGTDLLNTAHIEGSDESFRLQKLNTRLVNTIKELDSITTVYKSYAEKPGNDSVLSRLNNEYAKVLEKHRRYTMEFILQDQASLANIMALYQQIKPGTYLLNRYKDLQFFKLVTDSVKKDYPNLPVVKILTEDFNKRYLQYKELSLMNNAKNVGYGLPAVKLPDIKGDSVSLSSLKGKYVLLSFWATWNQNSVAQNLSLKDLYKTYHKKGFEIYQVSFDKSYNTWEKAIYFDQLPWVSVIDSTYPASLTARNYNVQNLPVNYLLNKDQDDIIGKNLSASELQNKLAGLFN